VINGAATLAKWANRLLEQTARRRDRPRRAAWRRSVAPYSTNVFLQPFGAGLLAGVIGALAVRTS